MLREDEMMSVNWIRIKLIRLDRLKKIYTSSQFLILMFKAYSASKNLLWTYQQAALPHRVKSCPAEDETVGYKHWSHEWGVCGLARFHTPPSHHWLLSWEGDHELITAFTLIQTYTRTLIPGGSQLLNELIRVSSKNTSVDTGRKTKKQINEAPTVLI